MLGCWEGFLRRIGLW